jgi:CelD/BcsL family acetyltransferase involved in cellulose biosynthesis
MNVAIRIDHPQERSEPDFMPGAGRFANIQIFDDLTSVEPIWRQLERDDAVKTPYQSFDFLASWQRQLGTPAGVTPFVVVGFDDAGKPAFLWPLGHARTGPINIVSFLGGKHANFNFALWRRDIVESITADDIRAVLARFAATRYRADILGLVRQPQSWEGYVNPFSLLPHQVSPSESLRITITARGEEQIKRMLSPAMRGRLRSKARRLQQLPDYRYLRATTAVDVDRLLDAFFPLKAAHMKAHGLPNLFTDPRHEAFLREACHLGLAEGKPLIELHVLEGDGELLALLAAINDGRRSSGMFNTYTMSDNARHSPGLVLLIDVVADVAERDVKSFDLGVGEAKYKSFFCKEPEPLFDSFLPLTPLGKLAAVTASTSGRVKRQIKQSNVLWNLIRTLRQGFAAKN